MRIYKKCPCCGKTIFLLLGSDFGNEIELGSAFGSKDNMPHEQTNHEEDYQCLNKFLTCLENSHGEVFLSLNEKEERKIPKDYQELILNWTEKSKKSSTEENEEDNTIPPQTPSSTQPNQQIPVKKTITQWYQEGKIEEEGEEGWGKAKYSNITDEIKTTLFTLEEAKQAIRDALWY